jgi:hypothetical protein
MDQASRLRTILANDPIRWHALGLLASLRLPDCWIGAGFIRNAVCDHLRFHPTPHGDADVVRFDRESAEPRRDAEVTATLRRRDPTLNWFAKNQARMHTRNGDEPYASSSDAMRHWPETATAVAVRHSRPSGCEIAAPFGLDDLLNG